MKNAFAIVGFIIIAAVLFWGLLKFKACTETPPVVTVTTPTDSNFAQVEHKDYRPASTPFEHQKPPAKLPSNIKESDVKEVIIVTKNIPISDSTSTKDTTAVIITKKGDVYVSKQGGQVEKVEDIIYKPAILQWGIFPSLGISIGKYPAPAIAVSPLIIYDRVKFPLAVLDYDIKLKQLGIGAGVSYRIWRLDLGIVTHWNTDFDRSMKFIAAYQF